MGASGAQASGAFCVKNIFFIINYIYNTPSEKGLVSKSLSLLRNTRFSGKVIIG